MKREQLFNAQGHYRFLLDCNVLLHRQAVESARVALERYLGNDQVADPVAVLDLACGGTPLGIAQLMACFPHRRFHYTGVDINPDQVALAQQFSYPQNTSAVAVLEGNAWDLRELPVDAALQIVFSGMNLHHGTPEEIQFLGWQIRQRMPNGGLLISHDVFRPDCECYVRRPEFNPANPTESFQLVAKDRLLALDIGVLEFDERCDTSEPGWRSDYLQRMRDALLTQGDAPRGVDETVAHMRQRDYPISTAEFRSIFENLGFTVGITRFTETPEPLGPYVAVCVARC